MKIKNIIFILIILMAIGFGYFYYLFAIDNHDLFDEVVQTESSLSTTDAEYLGTLGRISQHRDNATTCLQKVCTQYKSEAKTGHAKCLRDTYGMTHDQCLDWPGNTNYKSYNCESEDIIADHSNWQRTETSCTTVLYAEAGKVFAHEKLEVLRYIWELPPEKSSFEKEDVENIINSFPEQVDKSKLGPRLINLIREEGYQVEDYDYYYPKTSS